MRKRNKAAHSTPLITCEFCNAPVYWRIERESHGFMFKKIDNYPNMLMRPNIYNICIQS